MLWAQCSSVCLWGTQFSPRRSQHFVSACHVPGTVSPARQVQHSCAPVIDVSAERPASTGSGDWPSRHSRLHHSPCTARDAGTRNRQSGSTRPIGRGCACARMWGGVRVWAHTCKRLCVCERAGRELRPRDPPAGGVAGSEAGDVSSSEPFTFPPWDLSPTCHLASVGVLGHVPQRQPRVPHTRALAVSVAGPHRTGALSSSSREQIRAPGLVPATPGPARLRASASPVCRRLTAARG